MTDESLEADVIEAEFSRRFKLREAGRPDENLEADVAVELLRRYRLRAEAAKVWAEAIHPGLQIGQTTTCEICEPESGGYSVVSSVNGLTGLLLSTMSFARGDQVLAQFIREQDGKLFFSPLFAQGRGQDPDYPGDFSRVPRKPLPNSGSGAIVLSEPEPEEFDET